jgi:hypothetical protein
MKKFLLVLISLTFFVPQVSALKIAGVDLADKLEADGTQLSINGAGVRKKFFFKVYAGGLYLMKKCSNPETIVSANEPMIIRMHWIYDGVAPEKITAAWDRGFEAGTGDKVKEIQQEIKTFNGFFTKEAKANDIYDIIYTPKNGTKVVMNGNVKGTIKGLAFKKAVFGIWLGNNDELSSVKQGMLGQ